MSGIFTDQRNLSRSAVTFWYDAGGKELQRQVDKLPDLQETTSYRSGRELSEAEALRQDSQIFAPTRLLPRSNDTGHEFQTEKRRFLYTSWPDFQYRQNGVLYTRGPLLIHSGQGSDLSAWVSPIPLMTPNDQIKYGQRAISGCAPTSPNAGISAAIGELARDGIPSLIGSLALRNKRISSLGGEYLNVEFGWKPLVKDITKLMKSVAKSAQIIHQLQAGSGHVVRRRFSFPDETVLSSTVHDSGSRGVLTAYTPYEAQTVKPIEVDTLVTTRIYFSGAFSYFTDPGLTLVGKMEKYEALANRVLGTRLTPSVLYQLAPWSWLVDWFVDFGSAFDAASILDNDGLVIRWGYLMRQTDVFKTLKVTVKFPYADGKPVIPVINSYRQVRKERWQASPYGFAVNTEAFTLRQWAILGALGLTKGSKTGW